MRSILQFFLLLLASFAIAQDPSAPPTDEFRRTDAYLKVSRSDSGADLIEVTMLKKEYPQEILQQQLEKLGELIGSTPRFGVFERHNPATGGEEGGLLRVNVAYNGLVDRQKNILGLQAITRAFAGVPPPNEVNGLMIQYESETPNQKIVQRYSSDAVQVSGQADPRVGLEYRITLLTQDPEQITIPEGATSQLTPVEPKKAESGGPSGFVIAIIIIAAVAIGALVYSLLLRPKPQGRPR